MTEVKEVAEVEDDFNYETLGEKDKPLIYLVGSASITEGAKTEEDFSEELDYHMGLAGLLVKKGYQVISPMINSIQKSILEVERNSDSKEEVLEGAVDVNHISSIVDSVHMLTIISDTIAYAVLPDDVETSITANFEAYLASELGVDIVSAPVLLAGGIVVNNPKGGVFAEGLLQPAVAMYLKKKDGKEIAFDMYKVGEYEELKDCVELTPFELREEGVDVTMHLIPIEPKQEVVSAMFETEESFEDFKDQLKQYILQTNA